MQLSISSVILTMLSITYGMVYIIDIVQYMMPSILVSLLHFITLKISVFRDVTPCNPVDVL
jgi:hypothetical protein